MNDELPSVISGTRRKAQELADGTLRVMIDIDPRFKADFHRLFPQIDTPVAIAPLVAHFERIEEEEKQKGGPLCRLACIWCKDADFHQWFTNRFDFMDPVTTEEEAAEGLKELLRINSRKELDNNPDAAEQFQTMIRSPFMAWMKDK